MERLSGHVSEVDLQVVGSSEVGRVIHVACVRIPLGPELLLADLDEGELRRHVNVREDEVGVSRRRGKRHVSRDVVHDALNAGLKKYSI